LGRWEEDIKSVTRHTDPSSLTELNALTHQSTHSASLETIIRAGFVQSYSNRPARHTRQAKVLAQVRELDEVWDLAKSLNLTRHENAIADNPATFLETEQPRTSI
jgi:hypothetical protein